MSSSFCNEGWIIGCVLLSMCNNSEALLTAGGCESNDLLVMTFSRFSNGLAWTLFDNDSLLFTHSDVAEVSCEEMIVSLSN